MQNRIPNPRYPGSPARMADGRLFTDYRGNCITLKHNGVFGASFEEKETMQRNGQTWMQKDRSETVMRSKVVGCVDTMVPELTKRVCNWNGCKTLPAHAVGIGQGRLYMSGLTELVAEDPDILAAKTAFCFGTFPAKTPAIAVGERVTVMPAMKNRYSAPYAK